MNTKLTGTAPDDAPTDNLPVPPGYAPFERGGPYFRSLGALYQRPAGDGLIVLAVRVTAQHTNILGVTHGGMLLTLADGCMGINLSLARSDAYTAGQSTVTTTLSSQFLSSAHIGEWLEAHTRIRRNGRRLGFVECTLKVGDREVLHASGTFMPI